MSLQPPPPTPLELRVLQTKYGDIDRSGLSRSADMRSFGNSMCYITHDPVEGITRPIAQKGPNGTVRKDRLYDLQPLLQWLARNRSMPHNREDPAKALEKFVAVRWKTNPGDAIQPPEGYDWRQTARELNEARQRYARLPERPDLNEAQPQVQIVQREYIEDNITEEQTYRAFRSLMFSYITNSYMRPTWYKLYLHFYPYCERDERSGIQNPGPTPEPEQRLTFREFRKKMIEELKKLYPIRLFDTPARTYWIVHPIDWRNDLDEDIHSFFPLMKRSRRNYYYPTFFKRWFDFNMTRYNSILADDPSSNNLRARYAAVYG